MRWNKLKEMYDHLNLVYLFQAFYDWMHLRLHTTRKTTYYDSCIHPKLKRGKKKLSRKLKIRIFDEKR